MYTSHQIYTKFTLNSQCTLRLHENHTEITLTLHYTCSEVTVSLHQLSTKFALHPKVRKHAPKAFNRSKQSTNHRIFYWPKYTVQGTLIPVRPLRPQVSWTVVNSVGSLLMAGVFAPVGPTAGGGGGRSRHLSDIVWHHTWPAPL